MSSPTTSFIQPVPRPPLFVGRWAGVLPLLALTIFFVTGCKGTGYKAGETFDTSVRSVAVPIFQNRTFYRDVEFKLTEALTKEIESRTPYKVVAAAGADSQLTGTILNVEKKLLSRQFGTGLPQEIEVVVSVSFEWKDLRSGKIVRKRSRIQGTGESVLSHPVGEPFEVGRHVAVSELAREIVSAMRNDW